MTSPRLYYWPGMNAAISNMIDNCEDCQLLRPSQHEVSLSYPEVNAPMESVSLDLFSYSGKEYLVMVDRFSYYIWVRLLNSTTTAAVLKVLTTYFVELGYPFTILSDNGPQFRSEFKEYCTINGIVHLTSSPYNPRSNGLAESAVKNAKLLLHKSDNFADFQSRLQVWRNTPLAHKSQSPAQLFYGRKQRHKLLPILPTPKLLTPCQNPHKSLLPPLKVGDSVRVQDPHSNTWSEKGKILRLRDSKFSYEIQLENGDIVTRGRRLVKPDRSDLSARSRSPTPPAQSPPSGQLSAPIASPALDPSDGQLSGGGGVIHSPPLRRGTRKRNKKKIFDPS